MKALTALLPMAALLATAVARADVVNVDFTITDDASANITVTGEILGVADNASFTPASSVIIDSITMDGVNENSTFMLGLPYDTVPDLHEYGGVNLFFTSGGALQDYYYSATDDYTTYVIGMTGPGATAAGFSLFGCALTDVTCGGLLWIPPGGGFDSIIGPVTIIPVPEPATLGLLGLGIAGIGLAPRRRGHRAGC